MQKPGFGRSLAAIILGIICFCLLLAGVYWVSQGGTFYRTLSEPPRQAQSAPEQGEPAGGVQADGLSFDGTALWLGGAAFVLGLAVVWLLIVSHGRQVKARRAMVLKEKQVLAFDRTVFALCGIMENWDEEPGQKDHVMRVGCYARILARLCGMPGEMVDRIGTYAMLHDIGMIYVPRSTLTKSGPLTEEEYANIKKHVEHGYGLAARYGLPALACRIIRYHHEQWDGNGYHKLSGRQIPLEARIVCLADTYDALRMERVYRPSYTHREAVEVIREERGRMLDPALVDLFTASNALFAEVYERGVQTENEEEDEKKKPALS